MMGAWLNFVKTLIVWILFDKFIQKGASAAEWIKQRLSWFSSAAKGSGAAVYKGSINPLPRLNGRPALPMRVVERKVGGALVVAVANKKHVLPFHKQLSARLVSLLKSGTKIVTGKKVVALGVVAAFVTFAISIIRKVMGANELDINDEDLNEVEGLVDSNEELSILNLEGDYESNLLDFNDDGIMSYEEYKDNQTLRASINGLSNSLVNAIRLCSKYGLKLADVIDFFLER